MLRKKQTPPPQTGRNVRRQQSSPVFSYYSNRSTADTPDTRRPDVPAVKRKRLQLRVRLLASYAPTLAAGGALLVCLIYISTLQTTPKIQVLGEQSKTGIIAGKDSYVQEIQDVLDNSVLNRSKLLINTDTIADEIQDQYPELGEVSVVLPLVGRKPVVYVQPAEPALVLGTLDGAFVIDRNGRIVADAENVESSVRDALPVVQDESGLLVERGEYALPTQTVAFISEVSAYLNQSKLPIGSLILPTIANELHVKVKGKPYYAKFDLKGEGRVQAGTLIATKKKLDADNKTPSQYIDVRVPGKAYYK